MTDKIYDTKLTGLICPQCEDEASDALFHTKGIIKADVSYIKSSAHITYDSDITNTETIDSVLTDAGYAPGGNGKGGLIADVISILCAALLVFVIPWLTGLVNVPKAGEATTLGALFLVGLLTGVHCIGMCGGIMLTQSGKSSISRKISPILYNLGRIISYTAMGAVFGLIGKSISYDINTKSMVLSISGLLVLLTGLKMWGVPFIRNLSLSQRKSCELPNGIKKDLTGKPLFIGLATGLMPCGALSSMWLIAASSGSWQNGLIYMLVFSLGTVPAMLVFGLLGSYIPKKYNKYITKVSTVLITAMGASLFIKSINIIL